MLVHQCQQGSSEWLRLRAGIPTASEFDKILTPGGKPSRSAETYMFALLAERIIGRPRLESVSTWMDRGLQMEAEAVSFYELQRDCETVKVGFVSNDAGTIGASPDRLVGDDGLLEIKVPKDSTHVSYLLKKAIDAEYYPQVQGQLWVSERRWVDILSYHPEMPPALIRVERDEKFILLLSSAIEAFSAFLEGKAAELVERGWIKASRSPQANAQPSPQAARDGHAHDPAEQSGFRSAGDGGDAPASSQSLLGPEKPGSNDELIKGPDFNWLDAADTSRPSTATAAAKEAPRAARLPQRGAIITEQARTATANPGDPWTAEMRKMMLKEARRFWTKLAALGFGSIEAVPQDQRQGVMEYLRREMR